MTVLASAFGAALLISSGAFAQVPPDPNNPNENVPEKAAFTPYGETIKIEVAKKAAAAAIAEATKRGWPMCVAVVGPSGDLVYFEKIDDCQYASVEIAQTKARAAARFRRPTVVFERLLAKAISSPTCPRSAAALSLRVAAIQLSSAARLSALSARAAAPARKTI